tara:strand:+ start:121 stop:531 length:411 start_codon:yes stop_codon:yes gene_type:complete
MNGLVKWLEFPPLGDDRGSLVALEANETIPFEIKRVYYLFDTKHDVVRGMHAHLSLKQVILCVTGSCKILLDNGVSKDTVFLDSPTKGLLIESLVWREISDFSPDCVLLVIASEHYDESDYIRSYTIFREKLEKKS